MNNPVDSAAKPIPHAPILLGEHVAFTGTLASMTHRQAMSLVEQHGGSAGQNVSQQTTLMVIGEEGWPLEADGRISTKLEQARLLFDQGKPLRILSESEWLRLMAVEPQERKQQQLYTPAMLSQILNIPVHQIRRWERSGLIRSVKKVYRLPYFDFQEVTGARRLSELANSGVSLDELAAGLERLKSILPDIERPLAQLEILSRGTKILYRDAAGLVEPSSGQRVFDFEPAAIPCPDEEVALIPLRPCDPVEPKPGAIDHKEWTADDWFREGCRLTEEERTDAAIEAFRLALIDDPLNPAHHFHLADALYRERRTEAAIERYYMVVELDHDFLEAWVQLGCLLAEIGKLDAALDALRVALELHPDFPDAHFHLAELLERCGEREEAGTHWRRYLEFDRRGPWAEMARQRLDS